MKNLDAQYPDLAGQSVLITGGASGIGAALVRAFSSQGSRVGFIDIAAEAGASLAAEIAATGADEPLFLDADLRDISAIKSAADRAAEAHGPVTVLVNNAALDDRHDFMDVSEDYWDNNQAINLRPNFFAIQAVADGMKQAGFGSIINFTSTSYMLNLGGMPSYTTAKAGIVGLTKGMAGALGPSNIRVNAIAPGWVMTERQKELWVTEAGLKQMIDRQCIKEPIEPVDMVGPCLFLASSASRMITAQTILADGGML